VNVNFNIKLQDNIVFSLASLISQTCWIFPGFQCTLFIWGFGRDHKNEPNKREDLVSQKLKLGFYCISKPKAILHSPL